MYTITVCPDLVLCFADGETLDLSAREIRFFAIMVEDSSLACLIALNRSFCYFKVTPVFLIDSLAPKTSIEGTSPSSPAVSPAVSKCFREVRMLLCYDYVFTAERCMCLFNFPHLVMRGDAWEL